MIKDELYERIVEQLGFYVQQRVKERVEDLLPRRVEEMLRAQVPSGLAAELLEHRRQLEAVKLSLYNSEARRENSLLKYEHLHQPLHPLLRPTGEPCLRFPATLAKFFAMTPEEVHALMKDYNIPINEADTTERNLNKLMQHIGIAFQMVPSPTKPFRGQPLITFA
ncbi:hypothetical protein FRC03_004011 [Tulasnella sp. 419]|nr:hypothetical protein FRC03_004011 [Tulasnella sp. 419]